MSLPSNSTTSILPNDSRSIPSVVPPPTLVDSSGQPNVSTSRSTIADFLFSDSIVHCLFGSSNDLFVQSPSDPTAFHDCESNGVVSTVPVGLQCINSSC